MAFSQLLTHTFSNNIFVYSNDIFSKGKCHFNDFFPFVFGFRTIYDLILPYKVSLWSPHNYCRKVISN